MESVYSLEETSKCTATIQFYRAALMANPNIVEKVVWSIALPGFAQLLNGKLVKGIIFMILEVLINAFAHLNQAIVYSFHGDIAAAIEHTNYQWLMFYPCTYLFAIWDAHRDAGGDASRYLFLPYVCSAYFGTIGVIYSSNLSVFGVLLGPVFLPMLFLLLGVGLGLAIRKAILRKAIV